MSHGDEVIYLDIGALRRRYVLHLPPLETALPELPVVVMLDGRGGTPWTAMKITGWSELADRSGFAVAYPEALRLNPHGPQHFLDNPQMWNAGRGGSDVERADVDDALFLGAVFDDLAARLHATPERCFMSGFSNGAAMTFSFAATNPHRVAAIGVASGYCRVANTTLPHAVPTMYLFGALDPLSPLHGGNVELPWGKVEKRPPVMDSATLWARVNGLDVNHPSTREDDGVAWTSFRGTSPEAVLEVGIVPDLGHVWPGGHRLLPQALVGATSNRLHATETFWNFFATRLRPTS